MKFIYVYKNNEMAGELYRHALNGYKIIILKRYSTIKEQVEPVAVSSGIYGTNSAIWRSCENKNIYFIIYNKGAKRALNLIKKGTKEKNIEIYENGKEKILGN